MEVTFRIYLRVVGAEDAVKEFESSAKWPGATVRRLRRRAVWPPVESTGISWMWKTSVTTASTEHLSMAIDQFLESTRPLAVHMKQWRHDLEWVSLVIVADADDKEQAKGIHISPGAIADMAALGADLDYDVAPFDSATD